MGIEKINDEAQQAAEKPSAGAIDIVRRKTVSKIAKSPQVLAAETLVAVLLSENMQQAADRLGISRQHLYVRIDKYDLKDKIADLKEKAQLELYAGVTKAANKLVELIDSQDEQMAKDASESILDRVGLTKADKKAGDTPGTFIFTNTANFQSNKYVDKGDQS